MRIHTEEVNQPMSKSAAPVLEPTGINSRKYKGIEERFSAPVRQVLIALLRTYSLEQTAAILAVTPNTLRRYLWENDLDFRHVRKNVLVGKSDGKEIPAVKGEANILKVAEQALA